VPSFFEQLGYGVLGGAVTAILIWLWKTKVVAPKITFGSYIAKVKSHSNKNVYLIKITNIRKRNLINFNVQAILRIPGIVPDDPSRVQEFIINIDEGRLLFERRSITKSLRLCDTKLLREYGPTREIMEFPCSFGGNVLEELLDFRSDSKIFVIAVASDELTGCTKKFQKVYSKKDIKEGRFPQDKYDVLF